MNDRDAVNDQKIKKFLKILSYITILLKEIKQLLEFFLES